MSAIHALFRVSQRPVTLPEDLRGRPLFDASGERIGHIHDVLVEDLPLEETGAFGRSVAARYVEVGSGGRFHLGERKALLPVASVVVKEAGVYVDASRDDLFGYADVLPTQPKAFDPAL